jgi:uncharacterized membrane protein YqgA involved in biofilm formation
VPWRDHVVKEGFVVDKKAASSAPTRGLAQESMKQRYSSAPSERARRIIVLLLSIALIGMGIHAWQSGTGDPRLLFLLATGAVLGFVYAIFGRLPKWNYRASKMHWIGGGINEQSDPSNLSAKLYLPLLLGVILIAAALCYFFLPRR